jgi:hypothetical protein
VTNHPERRGARPARHVDSKSNEVVMMQLVVTTGAGNAIALV